MQTQTNNCHANIFNEFHRPLAYFYKIEGPLMKKSMLGNNLTDSVHEMILSGAEVTGGFEQKSSRPLLSLT